MVAEVELLRERPADLVDERKLCVPLARFLERVEPGERHSELLAGECQELQIPGR